MADQSRMFTARSTPDTLGFALCRWALVIIFLWFGAMKFQPYEAEGVAGIARDYWLFAPLYPALGVKGASAFIGVVEIAAGVLIALGSRKALASLIGGAMGVATFLVTLSFMASAPAVFEAGYGPPWLGSTGQFLIKDLALLGISASVLFAGLRDLQRPASPYRRR